MRKLLLMRGLPGCGKTTYVREQGLDSYTLSPDVLRSAYAGPIFEANGRMRIPAENDRAVWALLFELLARRMMRGELIIIDATHSHPRSFSNYQQLAKNHRYQVICVDFSDVDFGVCMERNAKRESYKVVPPLEMERMRNNIERSTIPSWVKLVDAGDLQAELSTAPKDMSHYKKVHHIGDVQGCFDPLKEYFETYGLYDDELYVFVGDYLDRGPQNAEVMQWLLENYHRENFIFIEGNHDAHLRNWARGVPARSREFNERTRPQLEGAGISPKKVYGFLYKLREMFYYTFHDRTLLVTHGGLSILPENLAFVASRQLVRGAGDYEQADESDANFAASASPQVYQIHGHRNRYSSPAQVNERCFNLEGKVEFAGELRTVTLSSEGFEERAVKSDIDASGMIVDPVGDLPGKTQNVATMVSMLRASNSIYENAQAGTNISSFNFKRDVFYNKAWDNLNVHARGLFINTSADVIVARSYEKFFNVGERPETQPDVLGSRLHFPVRAWVKENGYLGLVGYDPETNDFVFASKSTLTSDFAGWLRQQFDALVTDEKVRREIKLYVQSGGGRTLVFEVLEPLHDPHIIAYEKPELILLDIVYNTVKFEAEDEQERQKVAKMLGCRTKRSAAILKDHAALQGWLRAVQGFGYTFSGKYIEGFVLEDAEGFMVKVKLPWYGFWRQMRTQLQRLQTGKKTGLPAYDINNSLAGEFLEFVNSKNPALIHEATIVSLRDEFYAAKEPV